MFLMLAVDGTINRQGDGGEVPADNNLYIGQEPGLFEKFMESVKEEYFQYVGVMDYPDKKGKTCTLRLFFAGEEIETGFEFHYGHASMKPPKDVYTMVEQALIITESWYQEQRQMVQQNKQKQPKRKWWKFW